MHLESVLNIFSGLVAVAMVTTIVAHPGSASVFRAIGDTFASGVRAATGQSA
jgi:hypothetical protein